MSTDHVNPPPSSTDPSGAADLDVLPKDPPALDSMLVNVDEFVADSEPAPRPAAAVDAAAAPPDDAAVPRDDSRGSMLRQVDSALADDIDGLLDGDFQAVEEVLDSVFDEHAAIVQDDGAAPAVVPAPRGMRRAKSAPHRASSAAAGPATSTDPTTASPPSETGAVAPDAAPSIAEAAADAAALREQPPPPDDLNAHPDHAAAVGSMSAAAVAAPAPPARTDHPPRSAPGVAPATRDPALDRPPVHSGRARRLALSGRRLAGAAVPAAAAGLPLLISGLALLNSPLRLLPATMRSLVNLVAISLVLWVPLTWAMALYVVPRWSAPPAVVEHAAEDGVQEAGGHGAAATAGHAPAEHAAH